jgi:glycosyltransferase involved in cell wall biosynthesis
MTDQKKVYDDFYKNRGATVHTDPVRFTAIASLCRGKVLDLACGTGDLADFYSGEYLGVDVSDVGINLACEVRRKDAVFEVGDCTSDFFQVFPKVDTIVLGEFLEHIDEDDELMNRLIGSLNEDGRIIVSVPNGDRIPDPNHVREFTVPEIRAKYKKYGKITFHNYEGFAGRILFTIDIDQKNDDLLSLCMVVKNEGKGIENAILSCINFVDEIVISVDKSSNDETLALARRYAEKVHEFEWKNSFCQARNDAQKLVSLKWALILDGHEFVSGEAPKIEDLRSDVDGLFCDITMEDKSHFVFARIIRKEVEWFAEVHNYPLVKSSAKILYFKVTHDRNQYQSEESTKIRAKQRNEMIFSIMLGNIKKNRKDTRSLFYLGQQCIFEGRYKDALKWYRRYLRHSKYKAERFSVRYSMGIAHSQLGNKWRAIYAFMRMDSEMPGRWETQKRIGACYMWLGVWQMALPCLVEALGKQDGPFSFNPEERNDAETWDLIGQCFFNLKDYQKAKVAWNRCIELTKGKTGNSDFFRRVKVLEELMKSL